MQHEHHDKHAGHSPDMFKQKFWLTLLLSVPVLAFSPTVQGWLGVHLTFAGSQYIPAVFGTVIFGYGGLVFLKSARAELADRLPGMMTLISMAITVAFGYSLAVTLHVVRGMDFWWELATLVTIMLLGHWLEMAAVSNAEGALHELAKLLPDEAEVLRGDTTVKVRLEELRVGDSVLVRPGGRLPTDGQVTVGESDVNESMLTGESRPVPKRPGVQVIGGTINGSGALTIKVQKVGADTALAGIMQLVADAQRSKSRAQILADRAAFYLTFVALSAAVVTGIAWTVDGKPAGFVLERIVTVLVIACPHALGLAVPLVAAISTTLAAKNGLLVRQRAALEAARRIDIVLFDKTGTLTRGEQGVVDVIAGEDITEHALLAQAASVESRSEHPIAQAIVAAAHTRKLRVPKASSFTSLAGRGVRAAVAGQTVFVGGPQLITQQHVTVPAPIQLAATQASHEGKTVVFVVQDKTARGAIVLADVIRDESKQAVADLQAMGKRVAMLTGDSQGVAAWVAKELGIETFFAEVLPEHKATTVKQMQADGSRVAMVGDGVNDAPAMAQADVGIAIGAGTDVAIAAAGIVLASDDPRGVAKIVRLSRATYNKMLQNLAWAAGYNVVAIPLAAGVLAAAGFVLSPAFGAVLMSLSTIIVAANAQLLRKVGKRL